jgi:cobalamin biosynthesis protein CobT
MSTSSRVAGAVAAGYVLGRFKKLRLAVIVASAMSSPKVRSAAVGMIQERIPGGAMVGTLTKGVGGKLVDAGKTAATSIVASRIDTLSQSLADRSQNLRKGTPDGQSRKSRADEPGDGRAPEEEAYDEEERDATEEPEDEYDEEESNATEEPEDEGAQTTADDDESPVEEPEEPRVARSPRRPRSASPAGRRRG